jgi:hypothetical protein
MVQVHHDEGVGAARLAAILAGESPANKESSRCCSYILQREGRPTRWKRSQKDWTTWERIKRLADDWLPQPRILHSWPERRFAVRHPSGRSYGAGGGGHGTFIVHTN